MADSGKYKWLQPFLWIFKRLEAVGRFITKTLNFILVILVFFLAIAPLALFLKAIRKNVLEPESPASDQTFWLERAEIPTELERFTRQF